MNAEPASAVRSDTQGDQATPLRLRELVWYWGIVVAWMVVISTLSADPFSASNTHRYIDPVLRFFFPGLSFSELMWAHSVVRKTAHFVEFAVLGFLVFWASRRGRQPRWRGRWMIQALAVAAGYALLDEFHQRFVASRTASLADSGIDFLGAACSQAAVYLRCRWMTRTLASPRARTGR